MMRRIFGCCLILVAVLALVPAPTEAEVTARIEASSEATFDRPHDLVLAPDGKRLYVADLGNDVVKVLDPTSLITLGEIGRGELDSPHDVALDESGLLWVADSGNDRLVAYRIRENGARQVDEIANLSSPEGVAPASGGRIYLTNVGFHDVRLLADKRLVRAIGSRGSGPNQLIRPHDIDIGPGGQVYVSDPGNDRIHVLDRNLEPRGMIGGEAYGFNEPKYFAVNQAGWLFVGDEYNHQIKVLDDARKIVGVIGTGERGDGPDRFNQPEGVEVWGDQLWISDTQNGRIKRFRLRGLPPHPSE